MTYVGLWIGDALQGVFAAMGMPQVAVLTIAVGLFVVSFSGGWGPGHPLL